MLRESCKDDGHYAFSWWPGTCRLSILCPWSSLANFGNRGPAPSSEIPKTAGIFANGINDIIAVYAFVVTPRFRLFSQPDWSLNLLHNIPKTFVNYFRMHEQRGPVAANPLHVQSSGHGTSSIPV